MQTLFPPIKPFKTHCIPTLDGHQLYVEESGNPTGIPVLFVHGGPGGGSKPEHRRFFDPLSYRIILFDQRGCGQSSRLPSLAENTTAHLIQDMETIREALQLNTWVLFGTSFGSALSLLYAQAHPNRVWYLILSGTTLCRDKELEWTYAPGGASRLFPEFYQNLLDHVSPDYQDKPLLDAYYEQLQSANEVARLGAAKAWVTWHCRCGIVHPNPQVMVDALPPHGLVHLAQIQTHYFKNKVFLSPNQILNNMSRIESIPGTIVHGRYDMLCPVDNAYDLAQAWPNAQLQIVAEGGHNSSDPHNVNALVFATNQLAKQLKP